MNAARELLQLLDGLGRDRSRSARASSPTFAALRRQLRRSRTRDQRERDEPLLVPSCRSRSIRRRASSETATSRFLEAGELRPALCVCDRRRDEVDEAREALIGVRREHPPSSSASSVPRRDPRPRQGFRSDGGSHAAGVRSASGPPAASRSSLVDPAQRAGAQHPRGDVEVLRRPTRSDRFALVWPRSAHEDALGAWIDLITLATSVGSTSAKTCATSLVTAENSSAAGTPSATSVATRRRAACSSASSARACRDCAFAIAVATSSVKSAVRSAASDEAFPGCAHPAAITPHVWSSTRIGAPTAQRTPSSRASAATGPGASS